MVRSRIKGLLDKADRMGWFIFGQSEYKKARTSWVSSLELEPLNLNDETLRWSRSEWYQLFVIPISKEAEKRKISKSNLFIYLRFVENLSVKDISVIFQVSAYYVVIELMYFLVKDSDSFECVHSRSSEVISTTVLNEKRNSEENRKNLDLHVASCKECQNIQKNCLKNIFEYKKIVMNSQKEFLKRNIPCRKRSGLLGLLGSSSLFS